MHVRYCKIEMLPPRMDESTGGSRLMMICETDMPLEGSVVGAVAQFNLEFVWVQWSTEQWSNGATFVRGIDNGQCTHRQTG